MPTTRSPGAQRFQTVVVRHALLILVLVAAAAGGAAYLAAHLGLRTAISELLPSDEPGVVALHKTEKELEERTEWARRLEGETSALSHQLALVRESRWMKLGRKVGLGPVLHLK